jgi:diketogulonate reductase-like aldo/keto reductase
MNDVHDIPVIGLGVYKTAPGAETYNAVKWGLAAGYRLIDTVRAPVGRGGPK